MSDHHDHGHGGHGHAGHRHPPQADHDDTLTYPRKLEIAVRELLIQKGIISADEVRQVVQDIESRSPEGGARVVARAWSDPRFRQALLADATAAGDIELTGSPDAIERMFTAIGFPTRLLGT